MPASKRWAFLRNGKTANTASLRFLFNAEFGVELSASFVSVHDINSDVAAQALGRAGVFRSVLDLPNGLAATETALRLVTVRHPLDRAISSYLYLCKSQSEEHPWFSHERLRINALVGFDWNNHLNTKEGFIRFLNYVDLSMRETSAQRLDPHWRPQKANIRPRLYRPDIIGRFENLTAFRDEVAERLGISPAQAPALPISNKNTNRAKDVHDTLVDKTTSSLVTKIYETDYQWLAYDPDKVH